MKLGILGSLSGASLLAIVACSATAPGEGTSPSATSQALVTTTTPTLGPIVPEGTPTPAGQVAPSFAQVKSALAAFMGYRNRYPFESSNPTIGVAGQRLYGSESLWRFSAGDQGQAWHDANTVTMLADFQIAMLTSHNAGDSTYQSIIEAYPNNGYDVLVPFDQYACASNGVNLGNCGRANAFNDDDLWWALAYMRAYDLEVLTGDLQKVTNGMNGYLSSKFVGGAQKAFQQVCGQWAATPSCGGGVGQTTSYGPNASGLGVITNSLLFETAMQLYFQNPTATNVCSGQVPWTTGTDAPSVHGAAGPGGMTHQFANTYLGWALAEYEFFKKNWWSHGNMPMQDQIDNATCLPNGPKYTYNQGPILGALLDLSKAERSIQGGFTSLGETDSPDTVLDYGFQIASATMDDATRGGLSSNGILTEASQTDQSCIAQNNANGDCPQFKGVFMRYLAPFTNQAKPTWGPNARFTDAATTFINDNAASIWRTADARGPYFSENWSTWSASPTDWTFQTTETSAMDGLIATIGLRGPAAPLPPPPDCSFKFQCTVDVPVIYQCNMDFVGAPDPVEIYQIVNGQKKLVLHQSTADNGSTTRMSGQLPSNGEMSASFVACTIAQGGQPICDAAPTTLQRACIGDSCGPNQVVSNLNICLPIGSSCSYNGDAAGVWSSTGQCWPQWITCPPGEVPGGPVNDQYCYVPSPPSTGGGGPKTGGGGGGGNGGGGGGGGAGCAKCPKME